MCRYMSQIRLPFENSSNSGATQRWQLWNSTSTLIIVWSAYLKKTKQEWILRYVCGYDAHLFLPLDFVGKWSDQFLFFSRTHKSAIAKQQQQMQSPPACRRKNTFLCQETQFWEIDKRLHLLWVLMISSSYFRALELCRIQTILWRLTYGICEREGKLCGGNVVLPNICPAYNWTSEKPVEKHIWICPVFSLTSWFCLNLKKGDFVV